MLVIRNYDNNYCYIDGLDPRSNEALLLKDYLSYVPKGVQHMKRFREGNWDGTFSLLTWRNGRAFFLAGLRERVMEFLTELDVPVMVEDFDVSDEEWNLKSIPCSRELRDYQREAIKWALRRKRGVILAATNSGKTIIAYYIIHKLAELGKKTLFVVPRSDLVTQLHNDFKDYGLELGEDHLHVSTWQGLMRKPKDYFRQFDCIYVDEVHGAEAKSLKEIVLSCVNAEYRIGQTGTLPDEKLNAKLIEGLFGPIKRFVTVSKLVKEGYAAFTSVHFVIFRHDLVLKMNYNQEVKYLANCIERNEAIIDFVAGLNGNAFVLVKTIEHAKNLMRIAKERGGNKHYFVLTGSDGKRKRQKVYSAFRSMSNCVLFATYSLVGTGLSINNIDYLITAAPVLSQITYLQAIGRVMRYNEGRPARVIDIVDMLVGTDEHELYSTVHGFERMKYVAAEGIEFEVHERFPNYWEME